MSTYNEKTGRYDETTELNHLVEAEVKTPTHRIIPAISGKELNDINTNIPLNHRLLYRDVTMLYNNGFQIAGMDDISEEQAKIMFDKTVAKMKAKALEHFKTWSREDIEQIASSMLASKVCNYMQELVLTCSIRGMDAREAVSQGMDNVAKSCLVM
jgi:hypothetical protein